MDGARILRWAAWAGPLFTVVFFVVLMLQGSAPGEAASVREIVDYYTSHSGRVTAAVFLSPFLAALLVVFFAGVASLARENGRAPVGATVMVGGAVLWASGLLLGSVIQLTLLSSTDHGQLQVAQTANVLNNDSWIPFIAGIAVTMIGAGVTVLVGRILPAWLGWVALVAGVVSLIGPGGFVAFFVGPAWMLVVGVILGTRSFAPAPSPTP